MDVLLWNGFVTRMNSKKIYIIAGEASGDLHAGNLSVALKAIYPNIQIRGWGGNHLEASGASIDVRYERANFMGFSEVLKNLRTILSLFKLTKKIILEYKPDALILIDYPGFNLRMAKWAFKKNIPVYYYIAPQVWAWNEKRVKILREAVRQLFIILPFEKEYFAKHGIQASYFGHPLLQLINNFKFNPDFRSDHNLTNQSIIALLPGSRKQEIITMLPIYLRAVKNECKYQIVVAGLTQHKELYASIFQEEHISPKIVFDDTYNILHQARFAIVTSGTATLETALFGVPEIVCYKGNQMSYWLAKKLIKVKYICLVNLIADKKIVQELIQKHCNPDSIREELKRLKNHLIRRRIKHELKSIQMMLTGDRPYEKVAEEMAADLDALERERVNMQ
jgi:lipid-A-disaccharide synthase